MSKLSNSSMFGNLAHIEWDLSLRRREGAIEFLEIFGGEFDVEGGAVLANVFGFAGFGNDDYVRRSE